MIATSKLLVLSSLVLFSCNPCGSDEFIARKLSPRGRYEVAAYTRDCGATTSFATFISITDRASFWSTSQLIAEIPTHAKVGIDWKSEDLVIVKCDACFSGTSKITQPSMVSVRVQYVMANK
jgi:hypothetical protein